MMASRAQMDDATKTTSATANSEAVAATRLQRELRDLINAAADGIVAFPEGDDIFRWAGTIAGPAGTAYDGLEYRISLEFPKTFPFQPPRVRFVDRCFHPNVVPEVNGDVCLDILREAYTPALSVAALLLSLQSLLGDPNPLSPLNGEAADLWSAKNLAEYRRRVIELHGGGGGSAAAAAA